MSRILIFCDGRLPCEPGAGPEALCHRAWQIAHEASLLDHEVALLVLCKPHGVAWRHRSVRTTDESGLRIFWVDEHLGHERPEVVHRIVEQQKPSAVVGVGSRASSLAVNFCAEKPLWADLEGEPLCEAQTLAAPEGDAVASDAYAHLVPILMRADKLSTRTRRQAMALIGQLALLGRLSPERVGYSFVSTMPPCVSEQDLELFATPERAARGASDALVVLWSAGASPLADHETLHRLLDGAMSRLPTLRFVALGADGPGGSGAQDTFRERVSRSPWRHRCRFLGSVLAAELPSIYAGADIVLDLERWSSAGLLASSPELVRWLAAGLPVVCTRLSEVSVELERAGIALGAEEGDASALQGHLGMLARDPSRRAAMGSAARAWVEKNRRALTVLRPLLDWIAAPVRAPGAGKELDLRPLDRPLDSARQKIALFRQTAKDGGVLGAVRVTAEFVARKARSATGRWLARNGYDLGIPTVESSAQRPPPRPRGPSRPAAYWRRRFARRDGLPTVHLLVIVREHAGAQALRSTVEHLAQQYYPRWGLDVVAPPACPEELARTAARCAEELRSVGVAATVIEGPVPVGHGSASSSDFLGLLEPGVLLRADALCELVDAAIARKADLAYADEVEVEGATGAARTVCRPAWSPELLLATHYIGQPALWRTSLVQRCKDLDTSAPLEALEYDLSLQLSSLTDRIAHVPKPLCWRWTPERSSIAERVRGEQECNLALERCLVRHVWRSGLDAVVERGSKPGSFRTRHRIEGTPLVTIIVPTRDKLDLLRACVEGIEARTTWPKREILIIDNGSRERRTRSYLARSGHEVLRYDEPFNYSRLHNKAIRHARGDFVVLMNNDVEVITPDWIEALLEHAQRPEVGAVGAKLLHRDGTLQHAGIVLGDKGFVYAQDWARTAGQDPFPDLVKNFLAVTAACMMLRREVYLSVDGLDEKFAVAYNDVDLCLRLRKRGLRIVYTPHAVLYHHESATRGRGKQPAADDRLLRKRWLDRLGPDPYLGALAPARPIERGYRGLDHNR
ncbi:MAG: glycosyltransferase [Deltaproteobacteria bacterium]|nr:glycosyltransferase [Deltaproteobacteria bacterium]